MSQAQLNDLTPIAQVGAVKVLAILVENVPGDFDPFGNANHAWALFESFKVASIQYFKDRTEPYDTMIIRDGKVFSRQATTRNLAIIKAALASCGYTLVD